MTDKTKQTKDKRKSKGWRKHIRRQKQAARKEGTQLRGPA